MKGVQTFESEKKKKSRKDQNRGRKSEHSDQGTVNKMAIAKEPSKRKESLERSQEAPDPEALLS